MEHLECCSIRLRQPGISILKQQIGGLPAPLLPLQRFRSHRDAAQYKTTFVRREDAMIDGGKRVKQIRIERKDKHAFRLCLANCNCSPGMVTFL